MFSTIRRFIHRYPSYPHGGISTADVSQQFLIPFILPDAALTLLCLYAWGVTNFRFRQKKFIGILILVFYE